jgi:trimeric autotransporter adhesin
MNYRTMQAFTNPTTWRTFLKVLTGALIAVLVLGISDTARAQGVTLTVSPQTLSFTNIPQNSISQPQNVAVSATQATTVIVQANAASPWLSVPTGGLNIGTTPSVVAVTVNTTGLNVGDYQGSFTVSVSGQSSNQVTVTVNLSVGPPAGGVTATPSSLTFSAQQGATSATPSSTAVQITSAGSQFNYNITGTTQGGLNWLLLSSSTGQTGDAGFTVSANPTGLAGGVYTGNILVQSITTSSSINIPVTLTVNSNATLTVTPAVPAPFLFQIGSSIPAAQIIGVTATTGSVAFAVQTPNVSWLVVSPQSGTASANPLNLTFSVAPTGLAAGTYNVSVSIVPQNGSPSIAVPVTLVVSPNPLLMLSTNTLTYNAQFAGTAPPDQTVTVTATGTGGSVGFSFNSDSTWLTATESNGNTPSTLTVHVSPTGLAVGSYTGKITIRPSDGENYSQVLTVNLTVANASQLTAAPPVLLFSYQIGQAQPQPQVVQILSTTPQVGFTATSSTTNCGANWLSAPVVQSNTAPTTISVSVVTTGLTSNVCTGAVTLTYGSSQSLVIPVTLGVTTTPQLAISLPAGFGTYTLVPDGTQASQKIALTSTDPATQVTFTATSPNSFISLASTQGTTPANLVVNISAVGLSPGSYPGQIVISSPNLPNNSLMIPINLTVTPNTLVTVTPPGSATSPITFTEAQAGTLPASQVLTLASTGGTATFAATVSTNAGGQWLGVSPASGTASGPLTVSILQNSLSQGTYTGQIVLSLQNASATSLTIFVTLNVTAAQSIIVNPSQPFTFTSQIGAAQPAPQRFRVTSGGSPLAFTVASASTPSGWLSTDITSGNTPSDVNIMVNAAGLAIGNYTGTVTIAAPGLTSVVLTVNLTVLAAAPPAPVTISSNASGISGVIAPGEIISIYGTNLGPALPANGTSFSLNAQGGVDPTLAGVQVLFNGKAGTPLFVSSKQINVIVPYEANGQTTTSIVVTYQNTQSAPFTFNVAAQAPGIYTLNSQGFGQAAAVNQNGTFNGSGASGTTPSSAGQVIAIYATGGGQTSPPSTTGSVTPSGTTLYRISNVTATIGGQPAVVTFAGGAPGLVAGVIQVNMLVPSGVTGDALPVVINVNGSTSPLPGTTGPTVAVH